MTRRQAAFACILALAQLAGCASTRPYPDDLPAKNLTIRTTTSSGSMFSSVRATLGIHSVDAHCRTRYLGSVALDRPSLSVGIPTERWSYLVFDFSTAGFLGGTRTRISRGILLRPSPKHSYQVDLTYQDDIYNVVLHERSPRGASREPPLLDLSSCRPGAR